MKRFFKNFQNSKNYKTIFFMLILLEILFFPILPIMPKFYLYPINPIYNFVPMGPFIFGIYFQLLLMLVVFFLYKNIYLYIFTFIAFSLNFFLSYVGKGVSSKDDKEFILFLLPIIGIFIFNIIASQISYKYKKDLKWTKI
ncbi:hypothetical protein [uncultured Peptoniphilus sp.]|uniref:hypothetical protein n=1 Tax=uncultured Peptoniphilus sp. TaxID=254354 RepID=UPI00280499B0|nr:hypothetical protein [uncultured Peptoniphilus sp.]